MLKRHIYANEVGQTPYLRSEIVPNLHIFIMGPHISSLATASALESIALDANSEQEEKNNYY